MIRLSQADLRSASTPNLKRLAVALGLDVAEIGGASLGERRHRLVSAIAAAEKKLSRTPKLARDFPARAT